MNTTNSHHGHLKKTTDGYVLVPLRRRAVWARLDTAPFLVGYISLALWEVVGNNGSSTHHSSAAFVGLLMLQLILVLVQEWRISVRARVGYVRSSESTQLTHVLAIPPPNAGRATLVPVSWQRSPPQKGDRVAVVQCHEMTFRACFSLGKSPKHGSSSMILQKKDATMDGIWSSVDKTDLLQTEKEEENESNHLALFHRLRYPVELALDFYLEQWAGHGNFESLQTTERIYGNNVQRILLPPFWHLLREQLLAPFFLFQLLCVLLWSLDEYWYYALFTLVTLVIFESTMAYQRLLSLQRLRDTLRHSYPLHVYRFRQWIRIQSHELVCGDIVSLSSDLHPREMEEGGGRHIPADFLLLQGNGVVNEAMLTGESVPQLKEGITNNNNNSASSLMTSEEPQHLDMEDGAHKMSILFGGTVLVNHQNDNNAKFQAIPAPPDRGLLCFTLRTGFDTAQGSLLRTLIHTAKDGTSDGVNTMDTMLFILLLLVCAMWSASLIWRDGWYDENRNRFKLMLHVIIIITSVVPPELPMELSLAVTSSLGDLMKRCNVFCTEPFRIPLAGKVNVCCFDKTGTLTSDEMRLVGIRLPPPLNNDTNSNPTSTISCRDDSSPAGGMEDLVLPAVITSNLSEEDLPGTDDMQQDAVPWHVLRVMVGCQALALHYSTTRRQNATETKNVLGDPMERVVLDASGYCLRSNQTVVPKVPGNKNHKNVTMHHRFAFSSKLKRMTVLATETGNNGDDALPKPVVYALTKGAPETIKEFLHPKSVPSNYDAVFMHHMECGQRVLAMAYRELGSHPIPKLVDMGRSIIEQNLMFAGFLVLDCPLKPDSKPVIGELRQSGHEVKMITGDAVLTAMEVARQVGIIDVAKNKSSKSSQISYELQPLMNTVSDEPTSNGLDGEADSKFAFVPIGSNATNSGHEMIAWIPSNVAVVLDMSSRSEASFCVTGDTLTKVSAAAIAHSHKKNPHVKMDVDEKTVLLHPAAQAVLMELVPIISVFARHAPRQKEAVIAAFNHAGKYTLMAGDGTNDVGALKAAHVGISIISVPELEAKQREATETMSKIAAAQKKERKARKKQKDSTKKDKDKDAKSKKSARNRAIQRSLQQLAETEEELNHVSLGDASVASPFTSRTVSIKCCKDVLQQGRATAATMIQIYKILGINCLVNALVLTKLHLHGVKQGDRQLTAVGVVVAALFLFVTKGRPLSTLSLERPPSSVLCIQALLSIAIQFGIHFFILLATTHMCMAYVDPYDPSIIPDGAFNPNILNTCTFLLTVTATLTTFVVNYAGRPFMEDLVDNKLLWRSFQVSFGMLFVCALEIFTPLNQLLQLSPLPTLSMEESARLLENGAGENGDLLFFTLSKIVDIVGFRFTLCVLMVIDSALAFVVEKYFIKLL